MQQSELIACCWSANQDSYLKSSAEGGRRLSAIACRVEDGPSKGHAAPVVHRAHDGAVFLHVAKGADAVLWKPHLGASTPALFKGNWMSIVLEPPTRPVKEPERGHPLDLRHCPSLGTQ